MGGIRTRPGAQSNRRGRKCDITIMLRLQHGCTGAVVVETTFFIHPASCRGRYCTPLLAMNVALSTRCGLVAVPCSRSLILNSRVQTVVGSNPEQAPTLIHLGRGAQILPVHPSVCFSGPSDPVSPKDNPTRVPYPPKSTDGKGTTNNVLKETGKGGGEKIKDFVQRFCTELYLFLC